MITYRNIKNIGEAKQCLDILNSLNSYYPEFNHWYWNKVVPDAFNDIGEIIVCLKNEDIIGVSILKNTNNEKKLRCLRIKEEYQNKGYGLYLIDECLKRLKTDKPLLTVSEDMFPSFARIFINKYHFDISYVHKNLYKKNKLEYEFNGITLIGNEIKNKQNHIYKNDIIYDDFNIFNEIKKN